jgi:hypothetical protein
MPSTSNCPASKEGDGRHKIQSSFRRAVPCAETRFSRQMDKSSPVISGNLREDALLGNASGPLQAPFPGRLPEAMADCGLPDRGVCEDFASLIRALVCREILPADITECHGGSDARVRGLNSRRRADADRTSPRD